MRGTYAGLDLSLTATGVSRVEVGEAQVYTVKSKGPKNATLEQRHGRLKMLAEEIHDYVLEYDLIYIEQPAYNQTGGSHHDRSGLWWKVVDVLIDHGHTVVEVSPQTVKKYATGKGNAGKDEVLAAVVRRYPDVDVSNNNEADAFILSAIAARMGGEPLEDSLPLAHLAALDVLSQGGTA